MTTLILAAFALPWLLASLAAVGVLIRAARDLDYAEREARGLTLATVMGLAAVPDGAVTDERVEAAVGRWS